MDMNSNFIKTPYCITKGGVISGITEGLPGRGTTDSVVRSQAEDKFYQNLDELHRRLAKIEEDIKVAKLDLKAEFSDMLTQEEKEQVKLSIMELEAYRATVRKEIDDTAAASAMNFAETRIKGRWSKEWKEGYLEFSDVCPESRLKVNIDTDNSTNRVFLKIENRGEHSEDDTVEIIIPLTDRKVKNIETLKDIHIPSAIKQVNIERKNGFFCDLTAVDISSNSGSTISFHIHNGKIQH